MSLIESYSYRICVGIIIVEYVYYYTKIKHGMLWNLLTFNKINLWYQKTRYKCSVYCVTYEVVDFFCPLPYPGMDCSEGLYGLSGSRALGLTNMSYSPICWPEVGEKDNFISIVMK